MDDQFNEATKRVANTIMVAIYSILLGVFLGIFVIGFWEVTGI